MRQEHSMTWKLIIECAMANFCIYFPDQTLSWSDTVSGSCSHNTLAQNSLSAGQTKTERRITPFHPSITKSDIFRYYNFAKSGLAAYHPATHFEHLCMHAVNFISHYGEPLNRHFGFKGVNKSNMNSVYVISILYYYQQILLAMFIDY
jgi:hypothetical protein